jgi:ABC-type nitrate/sulfonate/bicarbonate transport system substrate-binding protein
MRAWSRPLRLVSFLGLVSLLAACAPSPSAAPTTPPAKPTAAPAQAAPAAPAPAATAAPAPASAGPTLKVAWGGSTATVSPLWLAEATGAFKKRGLNVALSAVQSSALTPSLVSKEVDVFASSAAPVLTADLNGGVDEVYVAAIQNNQTASLYVANGIDSADDLKGKLVGSDRPGTPTDFFTRRALTKAGLTAAEVNILPLGGSDATVPAFLSGQIQALAVVPPFSFQLDAKGYKQLATIVGERYLGMGFIVLRSRLDDLSPQLTDFVAAVQEGVVAYNEQPELARQIIRQYTGEENPDVLQKTYDFYRTTAPFEVSLQAKDDSFRTMLDYLSDTGLVPSAREADPSRFKDMRFVDKLPAR